ncbi:MAG: nitroreductase family protein [Proteobacteria bacterium]|jgi:nitroreductase|nr:nitroreductase family protein [Pseudomonadota bacterium]
MDELESLLGILRRRRSIRRFTPEKVDAIVLDRILEAVRWAPSAGNRQAYRFIVVTCPETIRAMAEAVGRESVRISGEVRGDLAEDIAAYMDNFVHFSRAPIVVVPIYRMGVDLLQAATEGGTVARSQASGDLDALSSICAAITHLLLSTDAAGLGACWMTGPLIAKSALREAVSVPNGWEIAAIIPIGHPAEIPEAPPRRPLRQLVRRIP